MKSDMDILAYWDAQEIGEKHFGIQIQQDACNFTAIVPEELYVLKFEKMLGSELFQTFIISNYDDEDHTAFIVEEIKNNILTKELIESEHAHHLIISTKTNISDQIQVVFDSKYMLAYIEPLRPIYGSFSN